MFHDGDLTSGISLAISQNKLVAILIRAADDNEDERADPYDSRIWEEYWLQNLDHPWEELNGPPFGEMIREKAVVLRIDFGSKEAEFLNAFCPVAVAPTFVVIKNGQVLEKVEKGVNRDEFTKKVGKAVGLRQYMDEEPSTAGMGNVDRRPEVFGPEDSLDDDIHTTQTTAPGPTIRQADSRAAPAQSISPPSTRPDVSPVASAATVSPTPQQSSQSHQAIMEERRKRMEEDKAKKDAEEKAHRIARAEARRQEAEAAAAHHNQGSGKGKQPESISDTPDKERARRDWLQQQKQRKDEAKKERERILERIENDKKDRKMRAEQAKQNESGESENLTPLRTSGAAATASSRTPHHEMCTIQVRLFDGSSIRSRFAPSATLNAAVRAWIKEVSPQGGADIPYSFRQILSPQPSRSIGVSEETQSLQELGLVPGATLVLVPVQDYTDAYAGGRGLLGGAWNLASGVLGTVGSFLPGFGGRMYMGGTGEAQERSNVEGARMAAADSMGETSAEGSTAEGGNTSSIRVKTLADQRAEAEARKKDQGAEFYNGNSSAFEGRKDD